LVIGLVLVVTVSVVSASANNQAQHDAPAAAPVGSGTQKVCPLPLGISDLTVKDRQVSMYTPDTIAQGPLPLILMFHGIMSSPPDVEAKARLQTKSNGRYLIAYPYGIGSLRSFNGAGCCDENGPDDVAFAKEIVLELEALGCARAYDSFVTGFSNGGFMSHRIGCEAGYRPDNEPWFRAIAPHSGLLGWYDATPYQCTSPQAVPIMSFHGATDRTVPISGANPNPLSPAVWQSFVSTRDTWARHNGCSSPREISRAPSTTCTAFSCPAGTSVEFCLAEGLGHNWMGNQNPEQDYDATKAIFEFFAANFKK